VSGRRRDVARHGALHVYLPASLVEGTLALAFASYQESRSKATAAGKHSSVPISSSQYKRETRYHS
jgi:hypothetical protein